MDPHDFNHPSYSGLPIFIVNDLKVTRVGCLLMELASFYRISPHMFRRSIERKVARSRESK